MISPTTQCSTATLVLAACWQKQDNYLKQHHMKCTEPQHLIGSLPTMGILSITNQGPCRNLNDQIGACLATPTHQQEPYSQLKTREHSALMAITLETN